MLRIEGEPVAEETVVSWLYCDYDRLQDAPFMRQEHDVRHTVQGLTRLLAFADVWSQNLLGPHGVCWRLAWLSWLSCIW